MLRVRLGDAEETVYRSVHELALGMRGGVITAAAHLFRDGRWVLLKDQPEYGEAASLAATLPEVETTDPLLAGTAFEVRGGINVYQMVSRSALELRARRRFHWVPQTALAAAGLLLGGAALLRSADGPGGSGREPIAASLPRPEGTPSRRAADRARPASGTASIPSPAELTSRWADAIRKVDDELAGAARAAGMRELLHPAALSIPDSVRLRLKALQPFQEQTAAWREACRAIAAAYNDSARTLQGSHDWSPAEVAAWRLHGPDEGSPLAVARVDTLLADLDRLYRLFLREAGRYRLSAGAARFQDRDAALTYDQLRMALNQHGDPKNPPPGRLNGPLMALFIAIAGRTLPPLAAD